MWTSGRRAAARRHEQEHGGDGGKHAGDASGHGPILLTLRQGLIERVREGAKTEPTELRHYPRDSPLVNWRQLSGPREGQWTFTP